jgi:hypothetical protein
MRGLWDKRRALAVPAVAGAVALAVLAAVAFANVTVYKNDFSTKREAKELRRAEGSKCVDRWSEHGKAEEIKVKKGPDTCGYRPPVQGDDNEPDHDFRAKLKISKKTPKKLRPDAFVAISVRSGKTAGYELRVFPRGGDCSLRRKPGSGAFPVDCTAMANGHVNGTGHRNELRLRAFGNQIKAWVNKTVVAELPDTNASEVNGRKLEVAVGNTKKTDRDVIGQVDDLKLQVPKP